jgi:hypothetical protein
VARGTELLDERLESGRYSVGMMEEKNLSQLFPRLRLPF